MRNKITSAGLKTRNAMVMPALSALYRCSESTGVTINDAFDNFSEATISGTAGTQLSSTPGWLALNGSDNYVNLPGALFPAIANGQAHLFAWNHYRAADNGAAETVLDIGSNSATDGVLRLTLQATGGLQLSTRGLGVGSNTAQTFGTFDFSTYNANASGVSLAVCIHTISGLTAVADLYANGVYVSQLTLDFSTGGGTGWARVASLNYVRLGALVGTPSAYLGGGAASSRVRNLLSYRQEVYSASEMATVILEHHQYMGEKLRSLA